MIARTAEITHINSVNVGENPLQITVLSVICRVVAKGVEIIPGKNDQTPVQRTAGSNPSQNKNQSL